jgi:hypothetical protein
MNQWVTFVKEYAKKHNLSYGCAISKPECKSDYQKMKNNKKIESNPNHIENIKVKSYKKNVGNQLKETVGMMNNDVNLNVLKKLDDIKTHNVEMINKRKEKRKVNNQLKETVGMMTNDVNVNEKPKMMKLRVKKKKMIIPPEPIPEVIEEIKEVTTKKPRGRPVKYHSIEEKKAMKLKQTLASNKKKRQERKNKVTVI